MTEAAAGGVVGVGVDVAATDRFERLLRRNAPRLWAHWYTQAEVEECLRHPRPALAATARFAVKEATYKAVGARFVHAVRWCDIEVLGSGPGWQVSLKGEVAAQATVAGAQKLHVTTDETADRVIAVVIARGSQSKSERAPSPPTYASPQSMKGDRS
ncbi:holo-ACP synthase [Nocardioides seonyuensis]|uniref:holo-ACP synthase n=1 Tax=Nocardioides seonyuensis TaxID=2518371 RepID=UPI001422C7B2|nr:4'-phosphopantetheinyl transferase superfamily protein [Nocardioides seonyuensis]